MNLNENNQLQGRVTDISEEDATARITIDIGDGKQIISLVPMDSVKKQNIRKGTIVFAVFYATSVMVSMDGKNYSDCSLGCDA